MKENIIQKLTSKDDSFGELTDFNVMFPFEYTVNKEQIMTDDHFILSTFDGETAVTLK